jgi:hypothetical protein
MNFFKLHAVGEATLVAGAPLLLAVVELFHPHPGDLLSLDVKTWLAVHYAQIPLFPLSALAMVALVRDCAGIAAGICRVAMFIFAVTFIAFDTAAGVVTGILVGAAQESGNAEIWRGAIDAVWTNPIVGGSPFIAPFLAVLGSLPPRLPSSAPAVRGAQYPCWRFRASESVYSRHTRGRVVR